MRYYLAVDIGASSGRHILGHVDGGRIRMEEIYRFENNLIRKNGALCWDIDSLRRNLIAGMTACGAAGKQPVSVGVDTWGVDFVLLDKAGHIVGDAVSYRDSRSAPMVAEVEKAISYEALFRKTGIQKLSFNTIYQLAALRSSHPEQLERAERLLMIPDYLHYALCGEQANEYTAATTTSLLSADTKDWDGELLRTLDLPERLFSRPEQPGCRLGCLTPETAAAVGFDCEVVLPASHDTGSAYLAVPAGDGDSIYLSSGTWSLLGVEQAAPVITPAAMESGFTNEGSYDYGYRFLKNIMGLWIIQSIRRNLDKRWSYAEMEQMARNSAGFTGLVDINDDAFLAPDSMIDAIREQCRSTGQPVPEEIGEVIACAYHSLADCYRQTAKKLSDVTGKAYTGIHIVGGGSKDVYLNQLTANATGLPVHAGPTEGSALGNLMAQMIAAGEFAGRDQARAAIRDSFPVTTFSPVNNDTLRCKQRSI